MDSPYVLFSSYDNLPDSKLHGLAFSGPDIILGNEGYTKFRSTRRSIIGPGEDGSYIVANKVGETTVIGTDFSGYHKLFLYESGASWAASNSLMALARFASEKNLPVTVSSPHLSSFFIQGSFGNQLTSLRTAVRQIRLVPARMEIVASSQGVSLRPTAVSKEMDEKYLGGTYETALADFLFSTVSRLNTVIRSGIDVRSDLTGGRDSRAILALMLAATNRDPEVLSGVSFRCNDKPAGDLPVAAAIAERYSLQLNQPNKTRTKPLSHANAYKKWKALNLGIYAPVYFPIASPSPSRLPLGGAGGEAHRSFYKSKDLDEFVLHRKRFVPSHEDFRNLHRDILEDIESLSWGLDSAVDPLTVHYRHFRDRCHGGRNPQYGFMLNLLSSGALKYASSACPPDLRERSQVLADIMLNCAPDLARMPYDTEAKSLDDRHFSDSANVRDSVLAARNDGQAFFAQTDTQQDDSEREKLRPVELMEVDFILARNRIRKSGYFPLSYLEKAEKIMSSASSSGAFAHAVDGTSISHIILAGELDSLSK